MVEVLQGNSKQLLQDYDENTFDSCVTDPPYEYNFMGQDWDSSGIAFDPDFWKEVKRTLKPGSHLLAFGGTRTYHRMMVAIEDAGFEIRDTIEWVYSEGFPKYYNIKKRLEKYYENGTVSGITPELIQRFDGWGTDIKPAHEPILIARKPLDGTLVENLIEHGTGAYNVDGCRIGYESEADRSESQEKQSRTRGGFSNETGIYGGGKQSGFKKTSGRFPANFIIDQRMATKLDEQSGITKSARVAKTKAAYDGESSTGFVRGVSNRGNQYNDTGGASRFFKTIRYDPLDFVPFFYCAKAKNKERDMGMDERNTHPTVKPIELFCYLIRLVTPPGGKTMDPFMGSGTSGIASLLEGVDYVGIENESDHMEIAQKRITYAENNLGIVSEMILGNPSNQKMKKDQTINHDFW